MKSHPPPRPDDKLTSGTVGVCFGLCCFSGLLVFVLLSKLSPESSAPNSNVNDTYYQSLKHKAQQNYESLTHSNNQRISETTQPLRYSLEWFDEVHGSADDVHLVISSGCTGYQNWQSESLLYSWARIRHPGRITRIVSGCADESSRLKAQQTGVPNTFGRIQWYFTKDFAVDGEEEGSSRKFVYFNKPFSMRQWIHSQRKKHASFYSDLRRGIIDPSKQSITSNDTGLYESYVVLIDPDFIILRPFLFHMPSYVKSFCSERVSMTAANHDGGYNQQSLKECEKKMLLKRGRPVSQRYGIGTKWLEWKVCPTEKCGHITEEYAWQHYSVGPPYMMHSDDWERMLDDWVKYSPAALKWEPPPSILAEMFSFSIACAMHNLPHELLHSMVSDPGAGIRDESWIEVNTLKPQNIQDARGFHTTNVIDIDDNIAHSNAHLRWIDAGPIHIIHTCQGFWLGERRNPGTIRNGGWNFHKGHVPQELLYDCDMPLMMQITLDESYSRNLISDESKRQGILNRLMKDQSLSQTELKLISDFLLKSSFVMSNMNDDQRSDQKKNRFGFYQTDQRGTQPQTLTELLYQMLVTPRQLFEMRDQSWKQNNHNNDPLVYKHVWFLTNVFNNINEATINFRRRYCAQGWTPQYGLVLQQPESDRNGRRMNYFMHDYESGQSWTGH